ncbi:MAG: hypothetical protein Unbinned6004contig1002_1 [Prokaryotic dsDNA virus sp.]|nr:MAG: hypothetical protein Unbinned6004contig1002_1 [Prokaryotic dsDNA virus sp.]|tara:strand:- start:1011 stop:1742 length:732 start_codon:yes stop_codon:yes gene_type:complete
MASTLDKIKNLLLSKEETKETKLYAEMILDDGRVLATEDDEFIVGSVVMVVGDDGETSLLSAGSYTLQDGSKITIDDDSKISLIGEEEEEIEAEIEEEKEEMEDEDKKEEMEEIDEEKLSKAIFEHTPDHIDEDKAKEMAKKVKEMAYGDKEEEKMSEEVVEEEKKEEVIENKEEEMVEMSKDMISSLVEEVEELKSQILELEKEPGADGFIHEPEVAPKANKKSLKNLSQQERVRELINNYK